MTGRANSVTLPRVTLRVILGLCALVAASACGGAHAAAAPEQASEQWIPVVPDGWTTASQSAAGGVACELNGAEDCSAAPTRLRWTRLDLPRETSLSAVLEAATRRHAASCHEGKGELLAPRARLGHQEQLAVWYCPPVTGGPKAVSQIVYERVVLGANAIYLLELERQLVLPPDAAASSAEALPGALHEESLLQVSRSFFCERRGDGSCGIEAAP